MKKHPLLKAAAAAAAAGAAVLGAAYGVYRVGFYNKPTTQVPSPADMPTRECYRKAMGPDADALARDRFEPVHITAQDGTPLAARYYHHADGAPLAIVFHGYRGYATRDGLGGYTLCTALGYNVLLPDQRAHGYSGGHTITMGVKERYDARDWAVWARSHFGPEVPIFLMGVSMGAATVVLAAGLSLPDNVCGVVADCGYTSPREITRKCLPEYLPGMPLELTYAVGRLGAILFGHFDPEDADCTAAAAQSKVPIFFVHGDADGFVPYEMGRRNYAACRARGSRFLTVHGAEHAVSYYHDNAAYTAQVTDFLQDCLTRRGFVWPPEADKDKQA
ncbi:MAG: alpha/beta hydrolase [Gemmiger sp.]|uniref:alpha/beta hydrolase n=2 Tax=Gemmiger sp. TaxID=2049027 RepID=UPI002E759AB4|nr:alpha/beta hydrolase [Gemmiger sp.]MEE0497417.1 alpha/beta hydrolase [Gemmiger sp.]